jgi:hypothetical protein
MTPVPEIMDIPSYVLPTKLMKRSKYYTGLEIDKYTCPTLNLILQLDASILKGSVILKYEILLNFPPIS